MTKWYNYGVCIDDESVREDVVTALEEEGLKIIANGDDGVKGTETSRDIDTDAVKSALRPYFDGISAIIFVTANDTSDTASATVYEVDGSSLDQVRSEHSGGTDSRYDWHGVSYNGLRVNGGKYY